MFFSERVHLCRAIRRSNETLVDRYMVGENGALDVPHREWLLISDDVQNKLKAELEAQGRKDEFIGARVSSLFHFSQSLSVPCSGYIYPPPIHHLGGAGLVFRRLHRSQAGISSFDCRYLSSLYSYYTQ